MLVFDVFWKFRVPVDAVEKAADVRQVFSIEHVFIFLRIIVKILFGEFVVLLAGNRYIFRVYVGHVDVGGMLRIVRILDKLRNFIRMDLFDRQMSEDLKDTSCCFSSSCHCKNQRSQFLVDPFLDDFF